MNNVNHSLDPRIAELTHGAKVLGRCGRAGKSGVDWEPPQEYELHIQKHRGVPVVLALVNKDFAEFDPRYNTEGSVLMSEDYYFEILKFPQ